MAIYENFVLVLIVSLAHLERGRSVDFEFCGQGEIAENSGRFVFNISTVKAEGKVECRRVFVVEERLRLTLDATEMFFQEQNNVEVYDGGFNARKITPVGPKRQGTYESTGNTMAVVLKAEKTANSSANLALLGTFMALEFQPTCSCKGIQNGIQRCWDEFGVRKCEVTCQRGFMDLTKSTGNFSCNLLNGKWNNGLEPPNFGCQSTMTPSVVLNLNLSFSNALLCNESSKENISSFFKDYFKARKSISENGYCFGQNNGNNCTKIDCVEKNSSSFMSVTINDKTVTKPLSVEEKPSIDVFTAYNSTSFEEIEEQLFAFVNGTLKNTSKLQTILVGNSVKRQCPRGTFLFINEGDIGHPACSKCPAGTFYSAFKCEKCPNGTSSLEGSESCSSEVTPSTPSFKDLCKIYCPVGKGLDSKTGFCQWCSKETYQNRTDVPNVNCSACPNRKRSPFPEATGISKCYVPCSEGTFFSLKDENCLPCPSGTYQVSRSHLHLRCLKCSQGKVTYSSGSTDPSQCVPSCEKGHFLDSKTSLCLKCPIGSFQDKINQLNCTQCPDGMSTLKNGSNKQPDCIKTCQTGNYFDLLSKSCKECPEGTYMDQKGHFQTSCIKCAEDQSTQDKGSVDKTFCLHKCGSGEFFVSQNGSCSKCPEGTYMDMKGHFQTSCIKCAENQSTQDKGSVDKTFCLHKCGSGEFFVSQNGSCSKCPEGTYMDMKGHFQTSCIKCAEDQSTQDKGSVDETFCLHKCGSGEFFVSQNGSCSKCPEGTYMDMKGHFQTSCIKCAEDQSTQDKGSVDETFCLHKCGSGEFFVSQNGSCSKCPEGTYMDQTGHFQTSCIPCAFNKTTHMEGAGHEKHCVHRCGLGEFFELQNSSCAKCPLGTYMNEPIHLKYRCTKCPPGTSTRSSGETTKLACDNFTCGPGKYIDSTKNCQPCPIGTYQSAVNHTLLSCQLCPSNITIDQGAKNLDSCVKICDSFPCENGAKCIERADNYCKCPQGVMGQRCEVIEKKEELIKLEMSLRFTSLNWSEELRNKTSSKHRQIKYRIENSLREELMSDESVVAVQVNEMVKGSVIANFDLYMNDNASEVPAKALQLAVSRGSIGGLPVDNTSLSIRRMTCDRALGMEKGRIKDGQINASSESEGQEASHARLNSAKGWLAKEITSKNYIQVCFRRNVNITAIATQGDAVSSYVTMYSLSYSKDGDMWVSLEKNFTGNNDTSTVIKNTLPEPITLLKYIRVIPVTWSNGTGMRIEFYGCISDPVLAPQEIPTTVPPVDGKSTEPDVKAVAGKDNEYSWGKYLGITFGLLMIVGCLIAFFMWWRNSKKKQYRDVPLVMPKEAENKALDKNDTLEYDEHAV